MGRIIPVDRTENNNFEMPAQPPPIITVFCCQESQGADVHHRWTSQESVCAMAGALDYQSYRTVSVSHTEDTFDFTRSNCD